MSAMSACFANPQQNPTTTHRLQLLERIRANIKRLQSQVLVDKVGTSTGGSARHKKRSSLLKLQGEYQAKLRELKKRDLPQTYSGTKYYQVTESMNILADKEDPMFSCLPAATIMLVASVVQGNIVLN